MITGDKGFVGKATTDYLLEKRHTVIGYDIMDGFDIRNKEQLMSFIEANKPDRVLHLAAIARFDEADANPKLAFETNVLGTRNVAMACKYFQIPLVHASTGSVYMPIKNEPPIKETWPAIGNSVYACSKAMAEKYVEELNPYIILRYSHLYGLEKRNEGLIGNFCRRIEHDLEPELYGGKQSSDFCYIKDVARANFIALTASWDKWNNAYNIGTGEELTAEGAAKILCDALAYKGKISIKPARLVDAARFYYDTTKSKEKLKFEALFNFEQGIKDMFREEHK